MSTTRTASSSPGGKNIRSGEELDSLSILDVAPALLYSMGLPVPEDYEGRVPEEAFRPEVVQERPVQKGEASVGVSEEAGEHVRDEEEQAEIMNKLKALGYME